MPTESEKIVNIREGEDYLYGSGKDYVNERPFIEGRIFF
jgi:hypothetical protein